MELKAKKFTPDAILPEYKTTGSAGADLCANETVVVKPGQATLIKLGIGFDIPKNHMMLLALRSSTPRKKGLFIPNGMGIIDSDYKGEFMLLVAPLGNEEVVVEKGERIAQTILVPCKHIVNADVEITKIVEVAELEESERGEGGFGSTGK
ncbi:MAG: Deoxyuridine 5'-triphosphate nucleotidohydrolase [Proteobacteria bacterium]|nr:MAG: Deoxyuridine 5'-triphosphate nucleotidohydrolase [Pseudomonadota bacterium]